MKEEDPDRIPKGGLVMPGGYVRLAHIRPALDRLEHTGSVAKYGRLQAMVLQVDVSLSGEFQKLFNGYYRAGRRKAEWYSSFYQLFEEAKKSPTPTFSGLLQTMRDRTGHVEASFVSKMLATLRPSEPVIDSVLLGHAGLKLPHAYDRERLSQCARVHQELKCILERVTQSPNGRNVITEFDGRFPDLLGISAIKKLDFVLWQIRRPPTPGHSPHSRTHRS